MDILKQLKQFHSHLGPFVVLGARMGQYAKSQLDATPFELEAKVFTSMETPESCVLDGIQFTSGCTMGKRNLIPKKGQSIKGIFFKGSKRIVLTVREPLRKELKSLKESELETYAVSLWNKDVEDLFLIEGS